MVVEVATASGLLACLFSNGSADISGNPWVCLYYHLHRGQDRFDSCRARLFSLTARDGQEFNEPKLYAHQVKALRTVYQKNQLKM